MKERIPCTFCTNGMYLTTQMDGRPTWAVCWHCLGCCSTPAPSQQQAERKAA